MSAIAYVLDNSIGQREALTQAFSVGGFSLLSFTVPVGGPFFAIPKDPQRRYLSFSVQSGQGDVIAIPGPTYGSNGFNLTAANLPWEIGGNVMQCLVGLQWLLVSPMGSILTVGSIRSC